MNLNYSSHPLCSKHSVMICVVIELFPFIFYFYWVEVKNIVLTGVSIVPLDISIWYLFTDLSFFHLQTWMGELWRINGKIYRWFSGKILSPCIHWNFSKLDPQKTGPPWTSASSLQRKSYKTEHPFKPVFLIGPTAGRFREVSL
jgi:hypothetical protein